MLSHPTSARVWIYYKKLRITQVLKLISPHSLISLDHRLFPTRVKTCTTSSDMAGKTKIISVFLLALSFSHTALAQDNPGVCPQDNGQYRTTSDGKPPPCTLYSKAITVVLNTHQGTYLITCNKKTGRGYMGEGESKPSLADCIDAW